jgi:hypothetical protein
MSKCDMTCLDFQDFIYKSLGIIDTPSQNIAQFFPECSAFIHQCRIRGQRVAVHCIEGKSRSATVVVAYLMDAGFAVPTSPLCPCCYLTGLIKLCRGTQPGRRPGDCEGCPSNCATQRRLHAATSTARSNCHSAKRALGSRCATGNAATTRARFGDRRQPAATAVPSRHPSRE